MLRAGADGAAAGWSVGAGADPLSCFSSGSGCASCFGSSRSASCWAGAADASPITPSWPPTWIVSSSPTLISNSVPATGDGTSVSTLSVEISTSGSSTATSSPTALSQRVTVPSVTDSPISGSVTDVPPPDDPPVPAVGFSRGVSVSVDGSAWGAVSAAGAASGSGAGSGVASSAAPPVSPPVSPPAPEPSPITPSSAPTAAVSSSPTTIFSSTPPYGEGISVSTLSVDTSSKGSSTSTSSPTAFSQRVTVPSVTLSPRAGIWTEWDMSGVLLPVT